MKTTKMGLKFSVFAAIVYFGTLQSPLIPLLMLGYVLLCEQNEEASGMACQAVTVLGAVWLVDGVMSTLTSLIAFLNTFVGDGFMHIPFGLDRFVDLALKVVLVVFGVLAFMGKYNGFSASGVKKMLNKVQENAKKQTDKSATEEAGK